MSDTSSKRSSIPVVSSRLTASHHVTSPTRSIDVGNSAGSGAGLGVLTRTCGPGGPMSTVMEGRSSQELENKSLSSSGRTGSKGNSNEDNSVTGNTTNNASQQQQQQLQRSIAMAGQQLQQLGIIGNGAGNTSCSVRLTISPPTLPRVGRSTTSWQGSMTSYRAGRLRGGLGGGLAASQAISVNSAWCEENPEKVPPDMRRKYTLFYNHYVCEGAIHEVNLSFEMRDELRRKAMVGDWNIADFDQAKEFIVINMFWNVYPRWLAHRQEEEQNGGQTKWVPRMFAHILQRNRVATRQAGKKDVEAKALY
ncbi:hypothetical protein HK101_005231 [Irineochytrium annulatum]|nr:hypothetical protein HK101_005231 [Irineochytrium annulatum]